MTVSWRELAPAVPMELVRYVGVSAAALAVDWGLLVALTEWGGLHYLVSAAVGFGAGLAVAYGLSVALVFSVRRCADPRVEFAVFCLVGLVGLGLTQVLLHGLVTLGGLAYAAAKLPTAGAVCLFNYAARRRLLFSVPTRVPAPLFDPGVGAGKARP